MSSRKSLFQPYVMQMNTRIINCVIGRPVAEWLSFLLHIISSYGARTFCQVFSDTAILFHLIRYSEEQILSRIIISPMNLHSIIVIGTLRISTGLMIYLWTQRILLLALLEPSVLLHLNKNAILGLKLKCGNYFRWLSVIPVSVRVTKKVQKSSIFFSELLKATKEDLIT